MSGNWRILYIAMERILTDFPVDWVDINFLDSNDIPNAGKPMSNEGKHKHEKCEDDVTVL